MVARPPLLVQLTRDGATSEEESGFGTPSSMNRSLLVYTESPVEQGRGNAAATVRGQRHDDNWNRLGPMKRLNCCGQTD